MDGRMRSRAAWTSARVIIELGRGILQGDAGLWRCVAPAPAFAGGEKQEPLPSLDFVLAAAKIKSRGRGRPRHVIIPGFKLLLEHLSRRATLLLARRQSRR